jgi:class 3 adenylate cyclase
VGRDVNLAARIVDLAGPGEVLCSEVTADEIGAHPGVGFEPLGPVFVRGISEPVPIMRVVAAADAPCASRDTSSR